MKLNVNDFFTNTERAITTELRTPQDNFPEHTHDFQELIIVSKGSGTHVINDVPDNLTQNHVCFVSPQDRHLFENVDNLFLSNILFRKDELKLPSGLNDYIPQGYSDNKGWHISHQAMQKVTNLVSHLDKEVHQQQQDSEWMAQALFQQLIVELYRGKLAPVEQASMDDKALQVLDWIKANYHQEFTISEIADKFHLSSRTLSRKIKQMTQHSFNNYLHQVRINQALQLLQYSELSVTDIAFKVGYSDSNYFSTKFKKLMNKCPSEYR
ncbi:MAG: helix-turn-helix domain-containing protein [Vibrio sp.]